jgi:transposase
MAQTLFYADISKWGLHLAAGQRAADIMSLLQTAKLNGHEPKAYLKDVLERLPTHPYSRISELLPTHWKPGVAV